MIRFYRQLAEQMLVALLYLRDRYGDDIMEVNGHVRNGWRSYNPMGNRYHTQAIVDVVRNTFEANEMEYSLGEMINLLTTQIHEKQSGKGSNGDKDLIDTLVRVIQLPYARNRISGEILDSLRKAILMPDEMAGLKERLAREEMSCGHCGHKFASGEIGSVIMERGKTSILCTLCYHPTMQASKCSKHSIHVAQSVTKAIIKEAEKDCEACKIEREAEVIAPPDNIGRVIEGPGGNANALEGMERLYARAAAGRTIRTRPVRPEGYHPAYHAGIGEDQPIERAEVPQWRAQPPTANNNPFYRVIVDGPAQAQAPNDAQARNAYDNYQRIMREVEAEMLRDQPLVDVAQPQGPAPQFIPWTGIVPAGGGVVENNAAHVVDVVNVPIERDYDGDDDYREEDE